MATNLNYQFNVGLKDSNVFAAFTTINQQINISEMAVNRFNTAINNTFSKLQTVTGGAVQIAFFERTGKLFQSLGNFGMSYGQSLTDLSAATGITGASLDALGENARKMGVKTGLGATQALKAYQTLSSQVDLSQVGLDGLNTLQEKTMVLAKASGLEVEGAANALTGTLNQFGLEVSQADRVMNILAAGARYGGATVPELSQALGAVGVSARTAGLSLESAAGALEVLGRGNLKGAEAGTALRDIMQGMQSALGTDFKTISLSAALENLRPKLNDASYLAQLFGEKNVSAAQYLIAHASGVQDMTAKVTDSNVAQEQMAIRSESVADRMAQMRQQVDDLKIGLFNLTGGGIGYVAIVGEMMGGVVNMIPLLGLLGKGFKALRIQKLLDCSATQALTGALNRQVIAQKLNAVWHGIVKGATMLWTGAQWALNVALNANPIGLIVAAIAALVGMIVLVVNQFDSWGATFLALMGPLGWLINAIILLKRNWESVTEAFQTDGIKGVEAGLRRIGTVLLDVVLYPLQQFLDLIGKIPGLSFAKGWGEKIQGLRDKLQLASPEKKVEASGEEATDGAGVNTGIATVTVPGTDNASLIPTYQMTSPAAIQNSSESTVSGGTRSTNVTISLGKLMDSVNIYAQEFRDGLNDLDNKVLESLTRVLNVAQSNVV